MMVLFLPAEQLSCCPRELPSAKFTYFDHLFQNCLCLTLEKSVVVPHRTGDIIHPHLTSVSEWTHRLRTAPLGPQRLPSDQKKDLMMFIIFFGIPQHFRVFQNESQGSLSNVFSKSVQCEFCHLILNLMVILRVKTLFDTWSSQVELNLVKTE